MFAPRLRVVFFALLAVSFSTGLSVQHLNAQVLHGSVSGSVADQSGAMLPGAPITITNDATGLKRTATTDSGGAYRFLDLPEGTYTLEVNATGFKALKKTNVSVVIGQVNQEDLQVTVGAVSQEVTVTGTAVVLQTQKADVHTTISSYAIDNLPLNSYHNFQTVELLAPGVFSASAVSRSYPNSAADSPDRSLNINSNGLPSQINTTRVDGATNLFIWLPNHLVVVPPEDTIQEVNVQTASFDVEKGLTAGVATDVITKSGTNQLHGSLYAFHSNQALNARNLYDRSPNRSRYITNNLGATAGGPIKKDKLFFFGNWDRLTERTAQTKFDLIPPVNYRQGDFSTALGDPLFNAAGVPLTVCTTEGATVPLQQGMVFDPGTGNQTNGTGRCVFSSGGALNVIPAGRINQGAKNFWALLPPPNLPGPFISTTAQNYFVSKVASFTRDIYTGKIDWNWNDHHTVSGKYTIQNFNYDQPFDFPQAGGSGTGPNHQFAQTITLGHTWSPAGSVVVTGHLGFTRMSETATPPGYGKPLGQTVLGIPGTNEPVNDIRYSGLPGVFDSTNYTTLGSATSWEPVTRDDWTFTTSHNLTKIYGTHELRVGVDAAHNHLNHFQPEIKCCPRGNLNFYGDNVFLDLPADPANPDSAKQLPVFTNTGGTLKPAAFASDSVNQHSIAVFDLGLLSQVQKSQQFIKSTGKDTAFGAYVGDRWKVTPKFTADLGLRWEYFPILTRDGRVKFELYDPSTNVLSLGGVGGTPTHLGVDASKALFSPRIGLAYRWNDKTVLRGGFGISNDSLPLERPLRGFYPIAIGADNFVPSTPVSNFLPYHTFAQGIPLIQPPDISTGKLTPPGDVVIGTLGPGRFKRAYVESWNLFVERQLPGQFLLGVGYVGNHYVHEFNGRNLNAGNIGGGSASQPLFSKYGRTGDTFHFAGYLDSHYNSLQVTLNRHTYQGLYMQGSYTYSNAVGYTDNTGWANGLMFNCGPSPGLPQGCQEHNRGLAGFDHRHMLKMAFVYELPFGVGKPWANSDRFARAILGGWQANGIFSAWTGSPLTLGGRNLLRAPYTANTPDQVAPSKILGEHGPGQFWFDTTAFRPVSEARLGTLGRNPSWLRGPGLVNMDFSVFRHFKVTERFNLEAKLEAQNVTNTPHFYNPNTFCSINVSGNCGGKFGQINSSYGERLMQIGLKLKF